MSGTKAGGLRAATTNKKKQADFYKKIGSKGGKARVPKGVSDPEVRKRAVEGLKKYFAARRAAKEAANHDESKEQP